MKTSPKLPRDLQAETAVLGSVLVNNEVIPSLTEIVRPADFYLEKHGFIFDAMCALHDQGKPVDAVTLPAFLSERNLLEKVGGTQYLVSLDDEIFTSAGSLHHARIVKEAADRRRLIVAFHDAAEKAGKPSEDLSEIVSGLSEKLSGVSQSRAAPLKPESTAAIAFIDSEPPPLKYIFQGILPEKIPGEIVGLGGVSKSYFLLSLVVGAATGQTVLHYFKPDRPFKTLALFCEDSQEELHRRVYFTVRTHLPHIDQEIRDRIESNLHVRSVRGQIGPLMQFHDGNSVRSEWYTWLRETVRAHKGLDLLVLDPKSRLYGLKENDNDDNTAWISCLESLIDEFGLTILFSHHASKASGGALSQNSSRGGGALVDGCRWVAGLRTMDEATGKKLGIDDHKSYVECDITKSNYTKHLPAVMYFKRSNEGVLIPANPTHQRIRDMADNLANLLREAQTNGLLLTRRELVSQKSGTPIREQLRETFEKVSRQDLNQAIDYALEQGWLESQSGALCANLRNAQGAQACAT